jgi:8-oxo-dGTP pyrophosphatase MutT (NUDIX family)
MVLTKEQILALGTSGYKTLVKPGFRHSAVLVPLITIDTQDHLILTRRSEHLPSHKGQVSFPGGAMDAGETPELTALRETEEEINIAPSQVQLVGRLDDIWTPSEYIISPVFAVVSSLEGMLANPGEVDRVFTAPLSMFADPQRAEANEVEVNGYKRVVYYYDYDGETIWGATAYIIRDLIRRIDAIS